VRLVLDVFRATERIEDRGLDQILCFGFTANKAACHSECIRVVLDNARGHLLALGRLGPAGTRHVPPLD
jgi:hypothetical protein